MKLLYSHIHKKLSEGQCFSGFFVEEQHTILYEFRPDLFFGLALICIACPRLEYLFPYLEVYNVHGTEMLDKQDLAFKTMVPSFAMERNGLRPHAENQPFLF